MPSRAFAVDVAASGVSRLLGAYFVLGKTRLSGLVVVTTLVGYVLGSAGEVEGWRLVWTLAGTLLAALGASGGNQVAEAAADARMARTKDRPVPAGVLSAGHAAAWSVVTGLGGVALLAWQVNLLTAALALACQVVYLGVYTPLKMRSTLNTLVGAVCGAIPPMMGWSAAAGRLEAGAWVLGVILFVWQVPHFLSLAWLLRGEYARAGFRMLPGSDPDGELTGRAMVLYSAALIPVALGLNAVGVTGPWFGVGAVVLGAAMTVLSVQWYRLRSDAVARRVFRGSLAYLPLLMALCVLDPADGGASAVAERGGVEQPAVVTASLVPVVPSGGEVVEGGESSVGHER